MNTEKKRKYVWASLGVITILLLVVCGVTAITSFHSVALAGGGGPGAGGDACDDTNDPNCGCSTNSNPGAIGGDSGNAGGGGSQPTPPTPTAPSFSATTANLNEGGSTTLTWTCYDSSSSSGVNFSTGGATSGSASVTPADTTTYTVICSNGGQSSATVTVLHPALSITATPSLLRFRTTSSIQWSATSVNSCSVSENNPDFADAWSGTSGTQTTSPITGETTYTLSCTTDAGTVTQATTITLIPVFQEF